MSKDKDTKKNPSKRLPENWDDCGKCPQPFRGQLRKIARKISLQKKAYDRAVKMLSLEFDGKIDPLNQQMQALVEKLREQYGLDPDHKVDTASGRVIREHDPRVKLVEVRDDICELAENEDFRDSDDDDPDDADDIEKEVPEAPEDVEAVS